MSNASYRKKISERLALMDSENLKQAWLIVQEIGNEKKLPPIADKKKLEVQLTKGIQQLDGGEGSDFGSFIQSMKKKYGNK